MEKLFFNESVNQIAEAIAYYLNWISIFWGWGYAVVSICRLIWQGVKKATKKIRDKH